MNQFRLVLRRALQRSAISQLVLGPLNLFAHPLTNVCHTPAPNPFYQPPAARMRGVFGNLPVGFGPGRVDW